MFDIIGARAVITRRL